MLGLLYTSRSSFDGDATVQLREIVAKAKRYNLSNGITGALAFTGNTFAQVLEGPEPAVRGLMQRIAVDPRHRDVQVLASGPVEVRRFPNWGMALVDADPQACALIDRAQAAECVPEAEQLIVVMERSASLTI